MRLARGDIVLVDFEPARRSEADKIRPSIIVTNDQANEYGMSVIVVPVTSNTERIYPFQLFLPKEQSGLNKDSKAQVELLCSVSKSRLGERVGSLPGTLLVELGERLKLHLELA